MGSYVAIRPRNEDCRAPSAWSSRRQTFRLHAGNMLRPRSRARSPNAISFSSSVVHSYLKKLQIVRGCDTARNILASRTYSDKFIDGSPKKFTSTVLSQPRSPRCCQFPFRGKSNSRLVLGGSLGCDGPVGFGAAWERMAPLIIGRPDQKGSTGRDNRMFVEGVLWIVRTGSPWRDLPEAFGDWNSVFRRFSRWSLKGVWWRIFGDVR